MKILHIIGEWVDVASTKKWRCESRVHITWLSSSVIGEAPDPIATHGSRVASQIRLMSTFTRKYQQATCG